MSLAMDLFPGTLPLRTKGNPGTLRDGASAWDQLAQELQSISENLLRQSEGITRSWRGDDCDAFLDEVRQITAAVNELHDQIGDLVCFLNNIANSIEESQRSYDAVAVELGITIAAGVVTSFVSLGASTAVTSGQVIFRLGTVVKTFYSSSRIFLHSARILSSSVGRITLRLTVAFGNDLVTNVVVTAIVYPDQPLLSRYNVWDAVTTQIPGVAVNSRLSKTTTLGIKSTDSMRQRFVKNNITSSVTAGTSATALESQHWLTKGDKFELNKILFGVWVGGATGSITRAVTEGLSPPKLTQYHEVSGIKSDVWKFPHQERNGILVEQFQKNSNISGKDVTYYSRSFDPENKVMKKFSSADLSNKTNGDPDALVKNLQEHMNELDGYQGGRFSDTQISDSDVTSKELNLIVPGDKFTPDHGKALDQLARQYPSVDLKVHLTN